MAISSKVTKLYSCGNCGNTFPLTPKTVGAIGDDGIFCPICTKALSETEQALWDEFVAKGTIPSTDEWNQMRSFLWCPIANIEFIGKEVIL
jgi:DNA-directed RNA polymerase subunit RPC12/RpoP